MHKVSIHIDGGYFLKRLPDVDPRMNENPELVAKALDYVVSGHLGKLNEVYNYSNPFSMLYRVFYYDALPFTDAQTYPVSGKRIDYSKTREAKFRYALHDLLKQKRKFALRLGKVVRESGWCLTEQANKDLRSGKLEPSILADKHYKLGLRQKGVDMRMGIDITSITLKEQAGTIVLLTGDSDFVPAAKLARREGVEIILDPMWRSVKPELHEHIDGLYSALWRKNEIKEM